MKLCISGIHKSSSGPCGVGRAMPHHHIDNGSRVLVNTEQ